MLRIDHGDGLVLEVPDGLSVLEASIQTGIQHTHACGGEGRCTTCRIEVLEGRENCPAMGDAEREVLALRGFEDPIRLACKLRPTGDVKIRRLVRDHPDLRAMRPEGMAREREVAILFADVRGFTTFSEHNLAFDVLHLLNRYFDRMGTIVEANRGRIITFLGDGAVCLFEGLKPDETAANSIRCGIEIVQASTLFNRYTHDNFKFEMSVGVGIDWGRAVIGQVGYYNKTDLNVIGDVVNTAARVQEATKGLGEPILITEHLKHLTEGQFQFGDPNPLELRGKEGVHHLFGVQTEALRNIPYDQP